MATTKNALAHLRSKHRVGPNGIITAGAESTYQQTIEKAFGQTRPRIIFNIDVFKDLLLQWIVQMNVSFRVCEDTTFRSLCFYLAACQPDYSGVHRALPQSSNTIKRYVLTWYRTMKEDVMSQLHATHTKIHFSFDMWSGPNRRAYQAIVAHWMARDGRLHAVLLSLHRFKGSHSGVNQAEHLWRTVTDYGIEPFVGMFNVDNASNNDTALVTLAGQLEAAGFPSFDPVSARLRCFGHVLNLAVKAILWGADLEAFEVDMNAAQDELAELLEWRRKGPMGKLHNILTYILKTPQRRDEFANVVRRLYPAETVHTVFVGNITRWSSDYESILRAFRLREAIEDYVRTAIRQNRHGERDIRNDNGLVHDELLPEDWTFLLCVKDILTPFKEWTLRLQVRYSNGCVADILPAMDELLAHLEDLKVQFAEEPHLLTMINNGWSIMDKYHSLPPQLPPTREYSY
jgi:hypothetical protein